MNLQSDVSLKVPSGLGVGGILVRPPAAVTFTAPEPAFCYLLSTFSGKGKQSAVKAILKDEGLCEAMRELGQSYTVSEELMEKCENICMQFVWKVRS